MWCVVTSFFIPALQNATFAAKNTAVSHKIVKVSNFPPVFTRFLLFLSSPVFERYDTEAKISNFLPFVCLFVKLDTYLAYLSPISLYSNDMTPNARNLKKNTCFPSFLKFSLFVKLDTCLAYLSQVSLYSNDMTPNSRNLKKKHTYFPAFTY